VRLLGSDPWSCLHVGAPETRSLGYAKTTSESAQSSKRREGYQADALPSPTSATFVDVRFTAYNKVPDNSDNTWR
jgi:hypothetical protein